MEPPNASWGSTQIIHLDVFVAIEVMYSLFTLYIYISLYYCIQMLNTEAPTLGGKSAASESFRRAVKFIQFTRSARWPKM